MPFFGTRKTQSASPSNPYNHSTSQLSHVSQPCSSPPPPYQAFPVPYPSVQPYPTSYPGPCVYPQPSSTHLGPAPSDPRPYGHIHRAPQQQKVASCINVVAKTSSALVDRPMSCLYADGLYDLIGDKFSDVVSLVDEQAFTGGNKELIITLDQAQLPYSSLPHQYAQPAIRGGDLKERSIIPYRQKPRPPQKEQPTSQNKSINVLSKVSLYSNSRLPTYLPPLRLYMSSWPLVCLAANYAKNAYLKPVGSEKDTFVNADVRLGTKAMVVKSVPIDDMNTIVFAIRGTSFLSLRDWGVNFSTTPVPPVGFLDDPGNLCHEGFLRVARAMVAPIAARLRHLLEENPSRAACSLLITGHSAGGAVAALLYSHMLSESVQTELNILTGCFKRIHCITFGAPPVSLLPLWKPENREKRLRKSLFLSFINEGDVVCRAEKTYIRSLVDLLASPAPAALHAAMNADAGTSMMDLSLLHRNAKKMKATSPVQAATKAIWRLPPATLSNAGRQVVLRVPERARERDVTASIVTDEQLRAVVFGDPLIHAMSLYAERIETLATRAVIGK